MAHPTNEVTTSNATIINIFFIEHAPFSLMKQLLYHCPSFSIVNNYKHLKGYAVKPAKQKTVKNVESSERDSTILSDGVALLTGRNKFEMTITMIEAMNGMPHEIADIERIEA